MRWTWKKRIFAAAAVLLFPVTVFATAPEATTELVYDLWYAPKYNKQLRKMKDIEAKMDEECRLVGSRIQAKEALVLEMMDGRRSLKDVCARFRHMSIGSPYSPVHLSMQFPHASEEEITARNVLGYTESRLRLFPGRETEIQERLEREFHEMFPENVGL